MSSRNYDGRNPPQNPNKYMNDFTKVLAGEVRMLLNEVGKLREEKAQLQSEIGELMHLKSRNGARAIGPSGEVAIYNPIAAAGWPSATHGVQLPPPASPPPSDPAEPARPGWRTVQKRAPRKKPPPPAPVQPVSPSPPPNLPAWSQWKPNPNYSVSSMNSMRGSPGPRPVSRPGLFGPPSPK